MVLIGERFWTGVKGASVDFSRQRVWPVWIWQVIGGNHLPLRLAEQLSLHETCGSNHGPWESVRSKVAAARHVGAYNYIYNIIYIYYIIHLILYIYEYVHHYAYKYIIFLGDEHPGYISHFGEKTTTDRHQDQENRPSSVRCFGHKTGRLAGLAGLAG